MQTTTRLMKKTIYIDMDDVLCDFTKRRGEMLYKNPVMSYPQSQYGFYENLEPILGGINAMVYFLTDSSYDPYILTAPSVLNPLCYTEKRVWVEKYLGMEYVNRLIISPNKSLLKGDYLIDDCREGRGQEHFEGKLIHFGSDVFPDWQTTIKYFESKHT